MCWEKIYGCSVELLHKTCCIPFTFTSVSVHLHCCVHIHNHCHHRHHTFWYPKLLTVIPQNTMITRIHCIRLAFLHHHCTKYRRQSHPLCWIDSAFETPPPDSYFWWKHSHIMMIHWPRRLPQVFLILVAPHPIHHSHYHCFRGFWLSSWPHRVTLAVVRSSSKVWLQSLC